jgi:hypothetical protein
MKLEKRHRRALRIIADPQSPSHDAGCSHAAVEVADIAIFNNISHLIYPRHDVLMFVAPMLIGIGSHYLTKPSALFPGLTKAANWTFDVTPSLMHEHGIAPTVCDS